MIQNSLWCNKGAEPKWMCTDSLEWADTPAAGLVLHRNTEAGGQIPLPTAITQPCDTLLNTSAVSTLTHTGNTGRDSYHCRDQSHEQAPVNVKPLKSQIVVYGPASGNWSHNSNLSIDMRSASGSQWTENISLAWGGAAISYKLSQIGSLILTCCRAAENPTKQR